MKTLDFWNGTTDTALSFNEDVISFIQENFDTLLSEWVTYPTIKPAIKKLGISADEYREIASRVLQYFIDILNGNKAPGDCPVMRAVVDTFYDKGLHVEEVFLNCTGLKDVLIENIASSFDKTTIRNLSLVFDYNLQNVLKTFTDKDKEHLSQMEIHAKIIEEHVSMTITNPEGVITYVTEAFNKLTGFSKEELIGQTHKVIRHPDMPKQFFKQMWETITKGQYWNGKVKNRKKDGGSFVAKTTIIPVLDDNETIIEYMAIRHDFTAKELANIDALTALSNRRAFDEQLKTSIINSLVEKAPLMLAIIDIDHFKELNDTYGHQRGDLVLKDLASVLKSTLRKEDYCFRWGGEEFVIILSNINYANAIKVAKKIKDAVAKHVRVNAQGVKCSIGIAQLRDDDTKESLFERADNSLYQAKKYGRNRIYTDTNEVII